MLRDDNKKNNEWNFLAPYPPPNAKQDKLVHRVELFATILKKVFQLIELSLKPISLLVSFFNKMSTKKEWKQRARAVPKNELIEPQKKAVYVSDRRQAMDQNFFYYLKHGRIWFKPISASEQSTWQLFGPDGRPPSGVKLSAISSDGVNLIAIDETDTVHYVHTSAINVVVTNNNWKVKKIKLDWTDHWYAIPIIKNILGLFRNHQLKLPKGYRCFAISQKGPETGYYTDQNGKKQPEFLVGVSTLYVLTHDGRIYFADPWLHNEFRNEITAPEDGQFVAENMAAAGSTIFLLCRSHSGKPIMYTRFADFDSIGSNPILPVTYNVDNRVPLVRYLPAEDWLKQPQINLKSEAKLTGKIAILQTGRGQNNRQLRVEAINENGEIGYYYKGIYEKKWCFESTAEKNLKFIPPQNLSTPPPPPVDLKCKMMATKNILPIKKMMVKKFLRHGFNERGLHTIVELTLNGGNKLILPLHAHRGLAHVFGRRNNRPYWELILPKVYKQDNNAEVTQVLRSLFNNHSSISVIVNELQNGNLDIINKKRGFKFQCEVVRHNKTLPATEELFSANSEHELDSVCDNSLNEKRHKMRH